MNRRFVWFILLACGVCGRVWADPAPAQDEGVPAAYKKARGDASAYRDDLTSRIKTEIAKLAKDQDPAGQTQAREWLISESVLNNTPSSTSDNYLDAYSSILNAQFMELLSNPDTSVRARVNVGIVAAKVAEWSKNTQLLPTVLQLLKDKSEAVVLWGEKAAGSMLPAALNGPKRAPLLDGIVQAALQHTTGEVGGYVCEWAYRDLNPGLQNSHPAGAALSDLVDYNLKLQQGRLNLYRTGVPPAPYNDTFASQFLLDPTYWTQLTEAQKLAAIQAAWNFISLGCEQTRLAIEAKQSTNTISELMIAVSTEAKALEDLANRRLKDLALTGAMHDIGVLGPGSKLTDIQLALTQGFQSLQAAFKDLQPAPEVEPRAAAGAGQ